MYSFSNTNNMYTNQFLIATLSEKGERNAIDPSRCNNNQTPSLGCLLRILHASLVYMIGMVGKRSLDEMDEEDNGTGTSGRSQSGQDFPASTAGGNEEEPMVRNIRG
jgi:hypothetical protein